MNIETREINKSMLEVTVDEVEVVVYSREEAMELIDNAARLIIDLSDMEFDQ